MQRSRRNNVNGKNSAVKEAINELKRVRNLGKSRIEAYKQEHHEPNDILKEVTEEEYSEVIRSRINSDFVVDDDGSGYVDHGFDDYEEEYSDYSEEEYHHSKKKRKRDEKENKVKSKNIKQMFSKIKPNNSKKQPKIMNNIDDAAFMSSLLGDLESKVMKNEPKSTVKLEEPENIEIKYNEIENKKNFHNNTKIKVEDDFNDILMDTSDNIIESINNKQEIIPETPVKIKKEEEKKTTELAKSPILSPYKIKREIVTVDESSIKKENKIEINRNMNGVINKMEMSPTKEIKIKKEIESSIMPEISSPKQQDWVNIHQSFSKNKFSNRINSYNQKIEFEEKNGEYFLFYWIDAMEYKGVVYLIGKVYDKRNKKFESCCVIVNNMMRNLFVLPRNYLLDENGNETEQKVGMEDVYEELEEIRKKSTKISFWKCKKVVRKYAFEEPDVPAEADYLKVIYSFKDEQFPSDITGKTFSRIFGTNTSALEHLIIKRKLMGPCWIRVTNYNKRQGNFISWCKAEVTVDSPKSINVCDEKDPEIIKEIPPFVVMSLNVKTILNTKKNANEIIIASAMVYPEVNIMDHNANPRQDHNQFTIVRKLDDIPLPIGFKELLNNRNKKVEVVQSESALLNYLMEIIQRQDPDIIVGHNFIGFHLDVLLHRMKQLNITNWSRIGRLRRKDFPKLQAGAGGMSESSIAERNTACGRLLCDTYYGAKDYVKSSNNGLTHLSKLLLNIKREDIEPEKTYKYFLTKEQLIHLIQHTEFDSFLSSALMFKIQLLPLTNQLTRLAGNLWSRTLCGARADRNEYLLLHEFHGKKFICPDKYDYKKRQNNSENKKKSTYSGGLVLEPKKGFYDKYILLLDFNSLYPSIIQEYNICFTTVDRKDFNEDDEENNKIPEIPDQSLEIGVLPKLLKKLVQRRRQVKSIIKTCKDPAELISLDIRQKALKLTANSMYGCLGYSLSRFYAKPIAMLITSKGREILQNTVDLAEQRSYDVIYGDTDSIMVNTNTDDLSKVKSIGNEIKKAVNEKYKLLEIEIDGYFRKMLLLRKKKYAALIVDESTGKKNIEKKGIDVVRREWCTLSINASNFILDQLFSDNDREDSIEKIYNYLQRLSEDIKSNQYSAENFIINKSLSKNPEDYPDGKTQPHVQVALRLKARGIGCHPGDTIQYIICKDDEKKSYAEKAYHPDELKMDNKLEIDYEWYLNQQILPPILRLCEPIEETDSYKLSKSLGLDPSKYQSNTFFSSNSDPILDDNESPEEMFKDVERWNPICYNCKQKNEFVGIVRKKNEGIQSGLKCPNCNEKMPCGSLAAQLHYAIRNYIRRYNNYVLNCDTCYTSTRQVDIYGRRCMEQDCDGNMTQMYSDKNLYTQLEYYLYLFNTKDIPSNDPRLAITKIDGDVFNELYRIVENYMEKNNRKYVNLKDLFKYCKT
jgi:DNA polymerase alpha subunit A